LENDKNWIKFIKSGKVADYLQFVNSVKEKDLRDGTANTVYNRGFSNKRDECGRE
jgi:hypothetical protein